MLNRIKWALIELLLSLQEVHVRQVRRDHSSDLFIHNKETGRASTTKWYFVEEVLMAI